jgi:hypothetical protein
MQPEESQYVRILPPKRAWRAGRTPGIDRALVYSNDHQAVSLLRMQPGSILPARRVRRGEELFVVEGSIEIAGQPQSLGPWTWRRHPAQRQPAIRSAGGALLWTKRGHL